MWPPSTGLASAVGWAHITNARELGDLNGRHADSGLLPLLGCGASYRRVGGGQDVCRLYRTPPARRRSAMADRRAGRVPHVRDEGGGQQPRSRNDDGRWRAKRSDAGKKRGK